MRTPFTKATMPILSKLEGKEESVRERPPGWVGGFVEKSSASPLAHQEKTKKHQTPKKTKIRVQVRDRKRIPI